MNNKNKVPRTPFEARKVAGSATHKRVKVKNGTKFCCPLASACLLSHENNESVFIYFVQAPLLIQISSPTPHSAPLNQKFKCARFQSANWRACHAMLMIQEQQKVTKATANTGAQEQPGTSPDLPLHVRDPPGG